MPGRKKVLFMEHDLPLMSESEDHEDIADEDNALEEPTLFESN